MTGCGNAEFALDRPDRRFTATPTLTLTPSVPTPTSSPTPTPTATPSPTPTPLPDELLQAAHRAYHNGDWETAGLFYNQLLQAYPQQETLGVQAILGLGRVYLAKTQYTEALDVLSPLLDGAYGPDTTATAHQITAEVLMASSQPLEAAPHFAALGEFYPILAAYTYEWEGDAYYAAREYESALERYLAATVLADSATILARLQEKVGLSQAVLENYEDAMAAYDTAVSLLSSEKQRARVLYQAVETAQMFGDTLEAQERMQQLVADYPKQIYAYDALVQLVDNGVPVDDMQRGLVDYYAEAYTPAVQAFARVVNSDPEHSGAPHYFAGLSFLEAGSPGLALSEFDTLLETHPGDRYWGDAIMGKAEALVELNRDYDAIRTYRTFVEEHPEDSLAPAALWNAAELVTDNGNLGAAAEFLLELANQYPDDEGAPEARFKAGLLYYQAALMPEAQQAWSDLILWYPQAERAQAGHFWLGKSYIENGEIISATTEFSAAITLDPWSFYGLQAASRQSGVPSFAPAHTFPVPIDSPESQNEAEMWLASWLELDPEKPVAIPEEVRADPRLERGSLLLALGYFDAGKAELESLRVTYADDPLAQYILALHFRDVGLYRSSIIAAAALWRNSPSESLETLPRFIGGLLYPVYYRDLVEEEAVNHNLDPLFAFALLRQESLFEGMATSFAAAHGLMQVIPSTGAAIAQALDWPPDYDTSDLYRPHISVRFGIWYLTQQLPHVDNNLFVAMAGYNGGPGNALAWWGAADKDEDLFVELISFRETSLYVRLIREHYAKYRWLYTEK
jgi:soluble lytic murein transglycosylase